MAHLLMEQIQFITSMWLLVAAGAALLGRDKGQSAIKWALLGLLTGPFALLGAAAIPPAEGHKHQADLTTRE